MKTRFPLLSVALLGAGSLFAAEAAQPACCPAPETKPACCVADTSAAKPVAACCLEEKPVAPLTAHSVYQLDAQWIDDAGRAMRLASLRGKPVVLAMFFAQCEYACPVLVNDIQRLRAALPESIRERAQLVLVSFDTVRDTPAALAAYRERVSLHASWTLLSGDRNAVQELAMLLGVKFKSDARGQFSHSNLFTILDSEGEIVRQHFGLNGDISEAAKAMAGMGK